MIPILSIRNLAKSFGGLKAVDDLNFDLRQGTITALIGPNGAGKSTCFNLLAGGLMPDDGQINFNQTDLTGFSQHQRVRAGVSRTFQIAATFSSMTVTENVNTALMAAGLPAGDCNALLSSVGLSNKSGSLIPELSYGDVKAVELAMALASRPRLLLLDEPTAGMAMASRSLILDRISQISAEREMTILFTEHDMNAVFGYASRVLVMDQGRLIADGSPDDIRENRSVQEVYLGVDRNDDA